MSANEKLFWQWIIVGLSIFIIATESASNCLIDSTSSSVITYDELSKVSENLRANSTSRSTIKVSAHMNATAEGRALYLYHVRPYISNDNTNNTRASYWFEGGIIANDFNSVSMLLDLVCQITQCTGNSSICNYDYYIVPMMNPDGYEYARTTNSSWLKNRQTNNGSGCLGINLNHNFANGQSFETYGTSDPCSELNRGSKPEEAMEVPAILKMKSCSSQQYTTSFTLLPTEGQDRLLWPLASSNTLVSNNDKYLDIAKSYDSTNSTDIRPYFQYKPSSGTPIEYWHNAEPNTLSFAMMLAKSNSNQRNLSPSNLFSKIFKGIEAVVQRTGFVRNTTITSCTAAVADTTEVEMSATNTGPPIQLNELLSGDCPSYAAIAENLEKQAKASPKISLVKQDLKSGGSVIMAIVRPYIDPKVRNPKPVKNRKSFWIEGGLEGNACDTVTSLLALVDRLATKTPREHIKNDYYIIPLMNPKGYEYARLHDEKWLKNRQETSNSKCRGIRLNNNFPPQISFNLFGSNCSCEPNYRGEYAGDAEEIKAAMKLHSSLRSPLIALSLLASRDHSILLYPYGYKQDEVENSEQYKKLGETFWRTATGSREQVLPYANWSMESGTSVDYWHEVKGSLSFTLLQNENLWDEVIGNKGKQLMDGLLGMISEMTKLTRLA